ncbi:MAG: hypothetical protein HY000_08220 [Planctomycetes bacterium]|nr:hypothetical protein [Planctomycetota bacterium]
MNPQNVVFDTAVYYTKGRHKMSRAVVSPGNKQTQSTVDAFVDKAVAAIDQGFHMLIVDVLPPIVTAYVEPAAIGAALPDMPLFLDAGHYVYVPLEATYESAWQGLPHRWRSVIEGHVG